MTLRRARPYWAGNGNGVVAEYSVVYSLRNVSGWTGDVIQVRRVSDSQDEWFGYSGGVGTEVDTSQISTFLGASAGRVRQLKNTGSIGTSWDLINNENGGPEIYDGTDFHFINGKIALDYSVGEVRNFTGVGNENILDLGNLVSIVIQTQNSVDIEGIMLEREDGMLSEDVTYFSDRRSSPKRLLAYATDGSDNYIDLDSQANGLDNRIISGFKFGNDMNGYIDGVEQSSSISDAGSFTNTTNFGVGSRGPVLYFDGLLSEIILDKSDPTSTRLTSLINDQKSFYGIA